MGMIIDKAYVGSSEVDKIYLGSELVWQALEPGIPVEGAPNGVYILHTNGTLYTRDQWKTSYNQDAVGVALITDNCKFVISPTESDNELIWSSNSELVDNVTSTTVESEAVEDYDGIYNTDGITSKYGNGNDYAAGWCKRHTFKNGKNGYLGSLGEFMQILNNILDINDCMDYIGGEIININSSTADYYASTQYNASRAWVINFSTKDTFASTKTSKEIVRPFAPLS